jgi:glycosyltransferase involved in cell wall biosynthesis
VNRLTEFQPHAPRHKLAEVFVHFSREPLVLFPKRRLPMKMEAHSVAFVLPCLNEAATLGACVTRARQAVAEVKRRYGISGEVIVADNGSTDGSQKIARDLGARVVDIPERGYGAALIGGFSAAHAEYLVMGDSDSSYDFIEAVPMIGALLEGADLCMGSRFRGRILPGAMPWKNRYIGNPVLSGILRVFFRTSISDAHCGLRALTRSTYERLNLSATGMEFASEMVLKAALLEVKIAEVPVTLSPDGRGRPPHLNPWRDGLRHLIYMFLLSPTWLFFVPATAMLGLGLALLTVLLLAGDAQMARFGPFVIGNHWAIAGSALVVIGVQTAIMGLLALLYSYREGLRRPGPAASAFFSRSRLEFWLLTGGILVLAGGTWVALITADWAASGFSALDQIRSLAAAFTMIIIGSQVFFAGFMLSILAGNRTRHGATI